MESTRLASTIKKTEKSMENSFDKIFREIERTMCDEPKKTASFQKISAPSLGSNSHRRIPEDKEFKKSFSRHWKRVEELHEKQTENRKKVNLVLRNRSKTIIRKWQKDLVDINVKSKQIKKEMDNFKTLLHSTPDITKREGRVARLHHHFRNSQRYVHKQHVKELKNAYDAAGRTDRPEEVKP